MTGPVVALSTVATAADAQRIATALVEGGLAACVNVVPGLTSIYRWKGRVERDRELLLVIKTTGERLEALRTALVGLHPYEVPELVALTVVAGHPPYLEWLAASVAAPGTEARRPPARGPGPPAGRPRPRSRR